MSADGLDIVERTAFVPEPLEGGAIMRRGDTYFCIGSHLSGWDPNPNVYSTAKRLEGPWSAFHDIAPPETNTYGGQSAMLLRIDGPGEDDAVIFIGDIWKPNALWDSRYLWMPMELHGDRLFLPAPHPWRVNVRTGTATTLP